MSPFSKWPAVLREINLYRLAGLEHEEADLLADYTGPGRIAFVEWPARGAEELGAARLRVELAHAGAQRRRIEVAET